MVKTVLFLFLQLGTYTIALCAKELNKPVYVLCESYKFVRLYPLNQQDMPNQFKVSFVCINQCKMVTALPQSARHAKPVQGIICLYYSNKNALT